MVRWQQAAVGVRRGCLVAARLGSKFQQARGPLRLLLDEQSRDKQRGERRLIGDALILLQAADLGIT